MNKRVIRADCLASEYLKIPHSFAAGVEALLPRNVPSPFCISRQICRLSYLWHCVVQENIHTPTFPRRATEIQRGGGIQISEGWGAASRIGPSSFFRGLRVRLMSNLSVILLLIGVVKQTLLFSLMIFYLQSAECFFRSLHDSLCNMIVISS